MHSKKKQTKIQKKITEAIELFAQFDLDDLDNTKINSKQNQKIVKILEKISNNITKLSSDEDYSFIKKKQQLFQKITNKIIQIPTIENLLKITLELSGQLLEAQRIVFYQLNPDHTAQVVAESIVDDISSLLDTTINHQDIKEFLSTINPQKNLSIISDVNQENRFTRSLIEQFTQDKVKSLMMITINDRQQKLYGLLVVHHCSENRQWLDREWKFLLELKQQLEYHLSYIDLTVHQGYISRQKQLFSSITAIINEIPEENLLFKRIVEGVKDLLNTDRVVIYQFNHDWTGQVVAEAVNEGLTEAINDEINDPCFKRIYTNQYQSGKVKAVNNVYTDQKVTDCYLDLLQRYQVKANLVVPLKLKEELYGLLIAHECHQIRNWQETDLDFMAEVATQFSICLESIHFVQEQQKITQQRQFFSAIASRTREMPEEDLLFKGIVEGVKEILNADRVVIYQFNTDWTGQVVAEEVNPGLKQAINDEINDPCFKRIYTGEYQSGKVKAVNNVYQDKSVTDCYLNLLERYQVKSNLAVPILVEEKLYGLLIVHQCHQFRYWQQTDFDFMSQITTEIGYCLDYINFVKQQEISAKKAWLFGDIAFRARQTLKIDDIFKTAVQGVRQMLDTDRVVIYQFNSDWSGTMVAESVLSEYTSILKETIDDPCFRSNYVEKYRNGRVNAIDNIRTEPSLTECHIRTLEKYQVKANLVAPVRQNNQLIGLIIAHHCRSPRMWQAQDLDFVSQLATQVEYALDHLSYIEKIEKNAHRSRLYSDIAFRARQSLNQQDVLNSAVQGARKELETDRVVVYKFDQNWGGKMISESVAEGCIKVMNEQIDDPCFRGRYVELYQNGRVSAINDIHNQPNLSDCHIRTLEQYDVKANLVAPIRKNGDLFGLLIAHHCRCARRWHKADLAFFSELATQTEYALDHISYIEKLEQAKATAEKASLEQKRQKEAIEDQLEQLTTEIQDAFQGNLTVRTTTTTGDIGQVADFVNSTLENLQSVVQQVKIASEAMIETVDVNQSYIQATYQETLHQAKSVSTVLDKIQQMNDSIQKVAHSADEAKNQVKQATTSVKKGDLTMNQTVKGISVIRETVEETALKLKSLGEASQKISRVVNLIKDLANQTHVLALNASIENRGQTESKSFGIVAEEIRSLSEQSAFATQEIEQILEQIQLEVNLVTTAMEKGREEVIQGVDLVENCRSSLNETSSMTESISSLVEDMAQAAINHAQTSAFVSKTMTEVENIAQNTAQQSVKGEESFHKLLEVAENLQQRVAQFKVD